MEHVRVYEVGPRDGLQNHAQILPARAKKELINLLSDAGFERIEATSFVSPKWVPQMADAAEVLRSIARRPGTRYAALTPNVKGFENACAAGVDEVAVFAAASEGFSRKNINCSVSESLVRFEPVVAMAKQAAIPVRGYVSCIITCPYDGAVRPEAVRDVAFALYEMGCYEISLGDTIGSGTPDDIMRMLEGVMAYIPPSALAGHFHDTADTALGNVEAALDMGLRTFDSAIGGLGGCPYAPGAKGNLSTVRLVDMLEEAGFHTGIDRSALQLAESYVAALRTEFA